MSTPASSAAPVPATPTPSSGRRLAFDNDEVVLCYHGPLMYEAKVLRGEYWEGRENAEDGPHYFMHYKGWKSKWDEWVPESRVHRYNEENLQRQQSETQALAAKSPQQPAKDSQQKEQGKDQNKRKRPASSLRDESSTPPSSSDRHVRRPGAGAPSQSGRAKGEIVLPLPEDFVRYLVDDWENVTKQQKLVSLPRDPSISQIIAEYLESHAPSTGTREALEALELYFQMALGKMLLYRFERQQLLDVQRRFGDKHPLSRVYGAEHLLRLYVKLPNLLEQTDMPQDAAAELAATLSDFMRFMHKNAGKFLLKEYDNPPAEYINMSKSL